MIDGMSAEIFPYSLEDSTRLSQAYKRGEKLHNWCSGDKSSSKESICITLDGFRSVIEDVLNGSSSALKDDKNTQLDLVCILSLSLSHFPFFIYHSTYFSCSFISFLGTCKTCFGSINVKREVEYLSSTFPSFLT